MHVFTSLMNVRLPHLISIVHALIYLDVDFDCLFLNAVTTLIKIILVTVLPHTIFVIYHGLFNVIFCQANEIMAKEQIDLTHRLVPASI